MNPSSTLADILTSASPTTLPDQVETTDYWLLLNASNDVVNCSEYFKNHISFKGASEVQRWSEAFNIQDDCVVSAIETLCAKARNEQQCISTDKLLIRLACFAQPVSPSILPLNNGSKQLLIMFSLCDLESCGILQELQYAHTRALNRLSVTLRSISEGVITTNKDGRIELINPEATAITGWEEVDVRGRYLKEILILFNEHDNSAIPCPIDEVLNTGLPMGRERGVLLETAQADKRKVAFNLAPILDADQNRLGSILVLEDVSQKNHIERELQKIQKMDSLALLSAGIAHDFNNFLTSIMGNLSLARSTLAPDDKLYKILKNAERGTQHAKLLTDRLYSFSKNASPLKKHADLGQLLLDTANFIFNGTSTQWTSKIAENLWACEVDEGQISQVLNNLFINANQAMPNGGKVSISASNKNMIWDPTLSQANGAYVEIKVKDEGVGIAPKNLEKLFEPYFTTKPKGNGLGLATCYSIIKNHDGHVDVKSTQGVGTTFIIYLPASPDVKLAKVDQRAAKVQHGEGHILVMDDEELVQDIAGQLLTHLGYTVEFAINGEKALEKYKAAEQANKPFDLVLLDLSITHGSGGIQALQALREHNPSVKALLSSGYSHREEVRNYDQYGFDGTIIKPYNIEQLSWGISSCLQS